MEARLLANVLQTDTHKRLAAAEEISEYLKKDDTNLDEFAEMDRFVSALAAWMGSSNFKVSVSAMEIMGILVEKIKTKFKSHLSTIFPPLKERLGDAKEQVREQGQQLIQQIFQNVVGSPQAFLDKLMDVCLVHKNWRVKEQGLLCLSRTLSYFGSGQVTVSKYMGPICSLLGDANSQVRSCAMETIVNIYRHVGVKVRIDVSRRNLQQSHLAKLNAQFDAVDATTGNSKSDNEDFVDDYDRESVSSSGSARTFGSTRSGRSSTAARAPPRPSSVARMATTSSGTVSGSGGVNEAAFEKAFTEIPDISMFTQHDVEKRVAAINAVLSDKDIHWEKRVAALKELRSVAKNDVIEPAHFSTVLRDIENAMELSLKDLRSQITREACITVSYLATVLGSGFAHFAETVIPQLIVLLPNTAKVMATSAEVCVKFIIKNTHSHRLLNHISYGMTSKSSVTRRQCAELISLSTSAWSRGVLEKASSSLEELIRKGLKDADAQARKHMRRAFWGYHTHFPSNANRMLDTFDPQLAKYVNDERALLEKEANGTAATATRSAGSLRPPYSRKKHAPPLASQSETCLLGTERSLSPPSPSKEPFAPAIRLVRPTIRKAKGDPSKILRPASSMETLLDRGTDRPKSPSTSPIPRPPSRTGKVTGIRPPSRSGIRSLNKRASGNELLPGKKVKVRSRSAQPSPSHSRESSPVRDGPGVGLSATLPQRVTPLTAEAVKKLQSLKDGVGNHDDDDAESVTSECSTFSISSEVSVSPYVRYPHPITDLNELVTLCSSSQWSERRDGIGQLHMLLESSRPFTHSDMVKVKQVFKRMLAEPHAKVFSMFLDTLVKFIEEHGEQLEDWLFIMLLRLIHRQGTDMLSSVHFKLQIVLEHIRKSFEGSTQFSVMCRILTDQTQPMNNKVKLGWLEYFLELLPSLDSAIFKDSTEIRQALAKLLAMTMEPKSADIRRLSQKVIIGFFDLNPATLTLLLRNMSKTLQESANRILKGYMNDMSSSSGEESDKEATPKRVRRRAGAATPTGGRTTPSGLRAPQFRPKTPQSSKSRVSPSASLPPSGPRGLRGAKNISSSSPAVNNMDVFLNRSSTKSQIPTPRSISKIPRRPGSTTPGASPSTTPATLKRAAAHPPRAQSVDPYRMASQSLSTSSTSLLRSLNSASRIKRPGSSRSEYTPMRYQNGSDDGSSVGTPGTLEQFSFSDLPHLDFGSPDEDEGDRDPTSPGEKDQMATVTRELQTASSTKNRQAVLQSLLTLSREYPDKCNWEEYFKPVLLRLLDLMGDSDTTVKLYSLRALREMLKTQHERLKDYSELTTLKVLKCFTDSDSTVSQASEDVFTLLAPALPSQSAVDLLSPMVATEKHPMLLGTIKLFTKVISLAEADYLRSKLGSIIPGIIRGYCHSESSVRKGSVFCLVALHSIVGDDMREHLTRLSSSQTKLLDLYIKRHQQEAASKPKT